MINNINLSALPIKPTSETKEIQQPSFGNIKLTQKADSFEPTTAAKQKSKFELALIGLTSATAVGYAVVRGKLGKALKLVGEKPALTVIGRLKQLSDFASKDGMTGLLNKTALLTNLEKEYGKSIKTNKNLTVAMLDMDNFKGINEIFSHDKGDDVLKRIASNIQEVATKNGVKGFRYGGEEFVITMADKDAASAKKIVTEIADAIKNDKEIQGLLPEFQKKAKETLAFITPKIDEIDSIFAVLKMGDKIKDKKPIGDQIISLIETHIQEFKPSDTSYLDKLVNKIKTAKPEELPDILRIKTIIEPDGTLGKELDKIHNQYCGIKNDLEKWTKHIDTHKAFTVSGGVINLEDTSLIKDGKTLVKVADGALKSAKENGKNQLITANDDIVKKTLEQINKNNK